MLCLLVSAAMLVATVAVTPQTRTLAIIGWSIGGSGSIRRGRVRGQLSCGRRSTAIRTLRDLCTAGEAAARFARFHERVEEVDGIPLQVLENTAPAGDVIRMHPLPLHAPPTTHLGSRPRFLLNKDIYL